jgi:hypothetical protein
MGFPRIVFATPRKLPGASSIVGRVAVLDIAFAAGGSGATFEKTTRPFIEGLGARLAVWVDHHDHVKHEAYRDDPRFVLATKAQHGACPEMVTPELVARIGAVDSVCCHIDFDGLCSAAKWIRGGHEPYPGADDDARAVDTRLGKPSELGQLLDRALRGHPNDDALRGLMVRFLADGATDKGLLETIGEAAKRFGAREEEARRIARGYDVRANVAFVQVPADAAPYDKTLLLMLGQEQARVSVSCDRTTVTVAARFDSGVDLLQLLELDGGMPTVVSVPVKRLPDVLQRLGYSQA